MATVSVSLRANQSTALSWAQVDNNFSVLAAQVNTNTAAIAAGVSPQGGTTGSRPTSPVLYQVYFDTTLGIPIWCKSNTVGSIVWVNAAGVSS